MSYKDDMRSHRVEEQQRAYVAEKLGLTQAELADYPFDVEEDMQQGEVVSWSIYWRESVPEDAPIEGSGRTLWTTIPAPRRS